ncbi:hypothetical protein [Frankia sp. CiP3]|uniref:hypothetical protein n=1 Tax=Frankia sp. CiP3 TaxID=2880971 RepID=UPI001EF5E06E|nr:hypothetical protein [Frankia sp. CiP3]
MATGLPAESSTGRNVNQPTVIDQLDKHHPTPVASHQRNRHNFAGVYAKPVGKYSIDEVAPTINDSR